ADPERAGDNMPIIYLVMMEVQPAQDAGRAFAAVALDDGPAPLRKPLLAEGFHKASAHIGIDAQGNELDARNDGGFRDGAHLDIRTLQGRGKAPRLQRAGRRAPAA